MCLKKCPGESKDDVLLGVASGPHFVPGNLELTYGGVTSIAFSADGETLCLKLGTLKTICLILVCMIIHAGGSPN